MSRISKEIKAAGTNQRAVRYDGYPDFLNVTKEVQALNLYDFSNRGFIYKIGLELRSQIVIDYQDSNRVGEAVNITRRRMIEYIFGEFREPIYKLRELIFKRDYDGAAKELDKIEKEMFE